MGLKLWAVIIVSGLLCGCFTLDRYQGNTVKVEGKKGQWRLSVNDQPFVLKGVGVGSMQGQQVKADYLRLARDMGANVVRTWGADQGTEAYLNKAHEYGLYVNAGIWLDPVMPADREDKSYRFSEVFKDQLFEHVISYVHRYKNHPAILFWNIGNETIYWTENEEERVAFLKFLRHVLDEVHRIDPHHPVIYTTAYTAAIPYIKQHVPQLDILGVNVYGGLDQMHARIINDLEIPYLVTEYGTLGNWDTTKDMNGVSVEANDEVKADYYKRYAHKIESFNGYCLGSFAFYLGDTTQVSSSWWNLTHGPYPKYSYVVLQALYTGNAPSIKPPVIKDIDFSQRKDLSPGEKIDVTVRMRHGHNNLIYEYFVTTASEETYLDAYPNQRVDVSIIGKGASALITAPSKERLYRVYAVAKDGNGLASVFNKSISVVRP